MNDPFEFNDEHLEPAEPNVPQGLPPYVSALNPEQRMAVEVTDGPVLVLAGAGTGKTRVLTTRLAHIMDCGLAYAGEIMAVTFTNKAAMEMKERVGSILGRPVEGWWLGTFHALAARMVRANAEVVGLTSNFTIIDTDDQIRLLKRIMEAEGVDEKKNPARNLMGVIQRWKDRGLTPDKVSPSEGAAFADGHAARIYKIYQERLQLNNACDFGDLLLHVLTIFSEQPQILEQYQRRFRYILVDEYQDTNVSQYLWLRLLAKQHKNICCVGDDDQSIYSWRGAEVTNILKFEKDFPGAKVIRLERNYRSTEHILGAASGLISYNEDRLGKTLHPQLKDEDPIKVRVESLWDGESEARFVGDEIEALQRKGQSLNEIAILVRAGFQTREFEERMITLGLPYKVVGGLRFYEREEIRDALAYLRVVNQPNDSLALERIINKPARGFGAKTKGLQTLMEYARINQVSLYSAAVTLVETDELSAKARSGLRELLMEFDTWRKLKDGLDVDELVGQVLDESGYMDWRVQESKKGKDVKAQGRVDNLKELVSGLKEFESLDEFLEHVSLVMEVQEKGDDAKVTIMTLHAAKGLEFDNVFLPGWEEGTFPNQRALDESGNSALEEERRLGYVGITRARKRSIISYALRRRIFGQYNDMLPSRFVDELPDQHIETGGETGTPSGEYGGGNYGFGGFNDRNQQRFTYRGERESRKEKLITIDAYDVSVSDAPDGGFRKGDHVRHGKFGTGVVLNVDGNKLDIAFAKGGRKKVIDSFVEKV
ncbi:putative DNA helicase II homolog [Candidatus Terasakiella magnetica]|uniref:DNA 3'-5' helicase n=1 Tax=Candidatus Terasakiella magnetica TaxID=1867952 RepID=A0A1C3RKN3_9PROT|nr:UvrD-helicase domain-containing protein [Candidatus Terasakiella magnetica]SCA57781.1 putative DNA helicase II homolog [Candidatus Terasakiella magnetica]